MNHFQAVFEDVWDEIVRKNGMMNNYLWGMGKSIFQDEHEEIVTETRQ